MGPIFPQRDSASSPLRVSNSPQPAPPAAPPSPPQGNILVDVPRFTPWLAQRLRQLGGARWIFLTHRDDVADHALWAQHLGAARIIHKLEARTRQGTEWVCRLPRWRGCLHGLRCRHTRRRDAGLAHPMPPALLRSKCEVMLEGEGPWGLPGSSADDSDVELIFTPGHTAGCVSLLFRPDQALFTGTHALRHGCLC